MNLKESPFPSLLVFGRVLVKALLVAAVINVVLLAAGGNPVRGLVQLNTFDLVGRARPRLAYPTDFQNGQLPVEALLRAHALSEPAAEGEYRVILLGDSAIAGWGVPDDETLAAELTDLGIRVGAGRVVAYNLAYPQPSAARDLIILDAALRYEPDLVVWFVTPASLNNAPDEAGQNRVFYTLNGGRLARLAEKHDDLLGGWMQANAAALRPDEPAWQPYTAIRDQDLLPVWLNSLFYPFVEPGLAPSDRRVGLEEVPPQARYTSEHPGYREMPNDAWRFLEAGCREALASGAEMLVVNQPIAIGKGSGSAVNYNLMYERALYDRYREALAWYADFHGLWYADLWDAIPSGRFTDTPTHMDALGYKMFAAEMQNVLAAGEGSTCR